MASGHEKESGNSHEETSYQFRNTFISAFCLSICWFGDAVIYLVLPLYAAVFGFNVFEVGALVTVNRVVRIVGYGWIKPLARRFGSNTLAAGACVAVVVAWIGFSMTYTLMAVLVAVTALLHFQSQFTSTASADQGK